MSQSFVRVLGFRHKNTFLLVLVVLDGFEEVLCFFVFLGVLNEDRNSQFGFFAFLHDDVLDEPLDLFIIHFLRDGEYFVAGTAGTVHHEL